MSPNLPSGYSKSSIDSFAEEIGKYLNFNPLKDSIENVIKQLGGKIEYVEDIVVTEGSMEVKSSKDFLIKLPQTALTEKNNFTLAHELGHYVLHAKAGKIPGVFSRPLIGSTTDRLEWEANWFAAGFLMPHGLFEKMHKQGNDLWALAEIFKVSYKAAEVRSQFLNL
ncbi:MAG: hypothetical protein A2508_02645 [Candidatus Lambdaproteobacteria bacterium RIFOXYD12_FULL_49_8]|uniref:IrrE N-terminal-like domain-containing protein n=1 Tax=Candidatus Lambdaproteobacteria bacterium RIFOXYD2_FULL_50_16 TaxID=1817772 RepID=A0A1F6GFY5_9PROT|nr:MAG: hypothetical protein A2527_02910 [Candidatus Lambdaproteobacteria bacterium RIFOXYD2_FULL_50_16]OGG97386.1 MAG: hypothetical protein A2508_02645 [Candidatus Lambdaproteobacteria bacterium RIFOXYD12_FULL_49_8]